MAAIDGLSSGLDTTSIIKQLMQLERQPQVRLQTRQSATESAILSLRTLSSKFLSISTATAKLGATLPGAVAPATPVPSDWQLTGATSSDAARVSVSAVTGAAASSLTFNVKQVATAASWVGAAAYDGLTQPFVQGAAATTVTLKKGAADAVAIDVGTGSLADVVAGINAANAGVTASTVQVEAGKFQLQLTSTTTGDGSIVLSRTPTDATDTAFTPLISTAGQDAVLVLTGGTEVRRASNTMSDVLQGVTLTVVKADKATSGAGQPLAFAEPAVTISVKKDTDAIAGKIAALVEAANSARSEARSLTAFDPVTKAKGRLYGDSAVRGLVDRVRQAISDGTAGAGLAGVTVTRDGTVEFDKAKFLTALAADPAAVEAALGKDGLAGRLHRLADEVTRGEAATGGPGLIPSGIKSRENQVAGFKSGIENWNVRLALKEQQLQRQYTALETALGKAKSQGQWLAGQLASLPTSGG